MSVRRTSKRDVWLRALAVAGAAGLVAFTGGAASAGSSFGTVPVSVTHSPALPQTTITSVRTGVHAGYDRIVIATTSPVSDYRVAFVSRVISSPKGTVVVVPGRAFLTITVHSVAWTGTLPFPSFIAVNGPELLAAVRTQQFEGYVTIALGLQSRTGFRVAQSGNLLIVDVQTTSATATPPTTAALPDTGGLVTPLALAALVLIGVGSGLVVFGRRRA